MGSVSRQSLPLYVGTGFLGIVVVAAGVTGLLTRKNTPSGASPVANIHCFTSTGAVATGMCIREDGGGEFSGSLVIGGSITVDGAVIGSGGSITMTQADSRYVNTSGDTMTGTLRGTTFSGATMSTALLRAKVISPRTFMAQVTASGTSLGTSSGKAFFVIPASMNGFDLVSVQADVLTAGTTNVTSFHIRNETQSNVKMLSTEVSIDSTETSSSTAATPFVINQAEDDVATGDIIAVDLSKKSTTAPKGLIITLIFAKP